LLHYAGQGPPQTFSGSAISRVRKGATRNEDSGFLFRAEFINAVPGNGFDLEQENIKRQLMKSWFDAYPSTQETGRIHPIKNMIDVCAIGSKADPDFRDIAFPLGFRQGPLPCFCSQCCQGSRGVAPKQHLNAVYTIRASLCSAPRSRAGPMVDGW